MTERKLIEESLQKALKDAKTANCVKSEFLSSMSHELRTPLNAIMGFSQLLQGKYSGELNGEQEEFVQHIHEGGRHHLSLIKDILDLSMIEAGNAVPEIVEVELKPLLENSLIKLKERCLNNNISLELHMRE